MSSDAAEIGDLVELRLDCLAQDELNNVHALLASLTENSQVPLVLTFRDPAQGGSNSLPLSTRRDFWRQQLAHTNSLCDLEYDLVRELSSDHGSKIDWSKVICSHHDFKGVPQDLTEVFEKLSATPAGVIKIAVAANDVIDCLPLFRLLERAGQQGRQAIILAMGNSGVLTRILGPSRGAYLTYGSFDDVLTTAPGQISAHDLRSVYQIDKIDDHTMITGLVGGQVMHSVSPEMHNAAFHSQGINGVYVPFEVSNLRSFVERMVNPVTRELNWNLRGLSITAPHKQTVIGLLDWVDPTAQQIGAVNTLVLDGQKMSGYNTDADGFLDPLVDQMKSLTNSRVAVLGAGGAANAVVWALKQAGAAVTVFARNQDKAKLLIQKFEVRVEQLENARFNGFDIVVNATPLGTAGIHISETPALADQLHGVSLVYDLIYNPRETELIRQARAADCQTIDGLSMLVSQALIQFKLWTGKIVSHSLMFDAALVKLARL